MSKRAFPHDYTHGMPAVGVIARIGVGTVTILVEGSTYRNVKVASSLTWVTLSVDDIVQLIWDGNIPYVVGVLSGADDSSIPSMQPTTEGEATTAPGGAGGGISGVTDHGSLAGLADDDHVQYAALAQSEIITAAWTFNDDVSLAAGKMVDGVDVSNEVIDHDHSGDAGDGDQFDAANLESGAAPDGQLLTADGAAGAAWEDPADLALDELTDVNAGSPSDDDLLSWDDGTSKWINTVPPTIPTAADVVESETTFDISADAGTDTTFSRSDHTHGSPVTPKVYTTIMLGDSSDPLTTGTDKNPTPMESPATLTIVEVRIKVKTAPTGQAILVDVNKNGTTIFTTQSNRPSIADAATEGQATTIEVPGLVKGDDLTFDIDQIGSGTAGSSLMVMIICEQSVG